MDEDADRAGRGDAAAREQSGVLVFDRSDGRRSRVRHAADEVASRYSMVAGKGGRGNPLLVLVGQPSRDVEVDPAVRRTGADGRSLPLIAYADDVARWPLAAKARLLLDGASAVLDSGSPTFLDDLRRELGRVLDDVEETAHRSDVARRALAVGQLVGETPAMHELGCWLHRVAPMSFASTLITGETGTGKELVARALHQLDPVRRQGPFVAINCASLPAHLLESELFGYRRGAFTGADAARDGLVKSADRGVLFLDEIGELDQPVQAKLLRVLQERRVRALGSDREVPVDIRVVSATNRPLDAMVASQTFRGDLLHRLSMLTISIPPLRERRADIPLLAAHICRGHAQSCGADEPWLAPDLLDALGRLDFPGNVRQLENVLFSAMARARDPRRLELADLPVKCLAELAADGGGRLPAETSERLLELGQSICEGRMDLTQALAACERILVERILSFTHHNQSRAARLLGITPRAVYNKVRRLKLPT